MSDWIAKLDLFKTYVLENKSALIERSYETDCGTKLGIWVDSQRKKYKANKLTLEQVKLLKQSGFVFDVLEYTWQKSFEELEKYLEANGTIKVPRSYLTPEGIKLGIWVNSQQKKHSQGKMSIEHYTKLEKINFPFKANEAAWNDGVTALKHFKEQEGHARVPQGYECPKTSHKLGTWVNGVRRTYSDKNLSDARIKELEALGFEWNTIESAWSEGIEALKAFYKQHGHFHPDENAKTKSGISLLRWVKNQKSLHADGQLKPERVDALEKIGFVWNLKDETWNTNFKLLMEFNEREGHTSVPKDFEVNDVKLGKWVLYQRYLNNRGELRADRKEKWEKLHANEH